MHELGIAESALRAALAQMEAHGAGRIRSITLRIGRLAAVDPEALRFAFAAISPGSPAEGAELVIEQVETRVHCPHCNENFTTESPAFFRCPRCGEISGELRGGREIELARLELDT